MVFILVLWVVWYALHSWLAALHVKNFVKMAAPQIFRYYRLLYNIVAFATLVPVMYLHVRLPDVTISELPFWLTVCGYALLVTGAVFLLAALKNYNLGEFAGFTQMNEFRPDHDELVVRGLNAYIRHPLYTASLMLLFGYLLISFTLATLIFVIVSTVYIFVGSALEERKLLLIYGEQYTKYRQRVGRFVPFLNKTSIRHGNANNPGTG